VIRYHFVLLLLLRSCSCLLPLLLYLVARGGIEPRAFPPNSLRFGLEDRCRERGRVQEQ